MAARRYTPTSHWCNLRHSYTNHDELIRPLEKDGLVDQIYYTAIHNRIEELLAEAYPNVELA